MFGTEAYYLQAGAFIAQEWGCTYKQVQIAGAPLQFEAYRFFDRSPIFWQDGIVGGWTRDEDDHIGNVTLHTTMLYYAP